MYLGDPTKLELALDEKIPARASREILEKGGFKKELGERNMFESKQEAIEQIYSRLNKQICDTCEKRIFHECNPHINQ